MEAAAAHSDLGHDIEVVGLLMEDLRGVIFQHPQRNFSFKRQTDSLGSKPVILGVSRGLSLILPMGL